MKNEVIKEFRYTVFEQLWMRNLDKFVPQINWSSGHCSRYPFVWLRDNCQCELCFHPVSLSRTFYLKDLDTEVRPLDVQVKARQSALKTFQCSVKYFSWVSWEKISSCYIMCLLHQWQHSHSYLDWNGLQVVSIYHAITTTESEWLNLNITYIMHAPYYIVIIYVRLLSCYTSSNC